MPASKARKQQRAEKEKTKKAIEKASEAPLVTKKQSIFHGVDDAKPQAPKKGDKSKGDKKPTPKNGKRKADDVDGEAEGKNDREAKREAKRLKLEKKKPVYESLHEAKIVWEKLRQHQTGGEERVEHISKVLELFKGKVVDMVQKHDAARVVQSCFKFGTPEQQEVMVAELKGKVLALARSHYGHHLLLAVLRHGTKTHKQAVLKEVKGWVADLLKHKEASTVLDLLYTDVCNKAQKQMLYQELWGKEFVLFQDAGVETLEQLFAVSPEKRESVLTTLMDAVMAAANKGLLSLSLVQRGLSELTLHVDENLGADIINTMREAVVHIMHTREGAAIGTFCFVQGDPKDRKVVVKAFKGFVQKACEDSYGSWVITAALCLVDDTVLMQKVVLAEMKPMLRQLSTHPFGSRPLLAVLAPENRQRYLPEDLIKSLDTPSPHSKKEPEARRSELLGFLAEPLLQMCKEHSAPLAISPHGTHVLQEVLTQCQEPAEDWEAALAATAEAAADTSAEQPLLGNEYAGRTLKRLVQMEDGKFAKLLLQKIKPALGQWCKEGGAWVVLALGENKHTQKAVKAALMPLKKELAKVKESGVDRICKLIS